MGLEEALSLPGDLLLWSLAVTFVAAFVQGTIGFGHAVVAVPILALVDSRLAPVPQLLQMVPLTVLVFWREREHADLHGALWTTIGRLPGTAMGVLLLKVATQRMLDLLIGGLVLIAVGGLTGGRAIPRTRITEFVAGLLSGGAAVISSIGGPPIALLYKDAKGATVRATLSAILAIGLVVTISARAVAGEISSLEVGLGLLTIPAVGLGVWASRFAAAKIEGRPLQVSILVVSAASAIALIARALFH
ncbi:MAG: sulfite exporter TauE/SafE family protein [Myxococcota bacterium]